MTLVASTADEILSFASPPFDIWRQPQRPGELTELIAVRTPDTDGARICREAVSADLPAELALYIAVEAARALDEAVDVMEIDRDDLIAFLDTAANVVTARGPRHEFVRPLSDYAAAVTKGTSLNHPEPESSMIRVPSRVAALWAHSAASVGVPFDRWIANQLTRTTENRAQWEAAAARTGRTLSEWILLQAARCARSSNAAPQRTASG